ncbi:MAG: NAD(P)-dependent alcohol dehydrogenase [Vampirovibrio sp.]|nr:NAD(P)-dependent alcohol dehydrogenase [Vampirovibrio sp.]
MKAWEIQESFGISHLVQVERPDPTPGPYEVVVKMTAMSLNYRDLMMVTGRYNPRQPLPLVPLSDGVGEVISVGAEVTQVQPGDRVAGCFFEHWTCGKPSREALKSSQGGPADGMLMTHKIIHENGVVHVPAYLSDEEAATLPCAAVTAWNALFTEGNLRPGETVLCLGTGGVSVFAAQLALAVGARPIVTSSSDEKLTKLQALGISAGDCINYRNTPDWEESVLSLTDGVGVDHILEVGGAGTLEKSLACVRFGGNIYQIGILAGVTKDMSVIPILRNRVRVQGIYVGDRQSFDAMNAGIAQTKIQPVIDRVFDFEEAPEAFTHIEAAAHVGKICIRV